MYTSNNPLVVIKNGVSTRLDTLAYNVSTKAGMIRMAGLRGESPEIVGRSGSLYTSGKPRDNGRFVISGWARDTDVDGVPGSDRYATWRSNMDKLLWLFDTQYSRILVREYITSLSTPSSALPSSGYREAEVEVTAAIDPEQLGKTFGEFKVECTINDVFWRSEEDVNWLSPTGPTSIGTHSLPTLAGSTAPIYDAVISVYGFIGNPRLTDPVTGHYVQLNGAFATGPWVLDCKNWTSKLGGINQANNTDVVGKLTPYLFGISPAGPGAAPTIQLSGGSANSNTRFAVLARKKFH